METILLIEDNTEMLDNLTEYLELEGYRILSANNGKSGVALSNEFIPDLIICDVLMRGMDGYAVLRLLLDAVRTSEIPFIFSTSMAENIDKVKSLKLGADDYIVKPFEPDTLLNMVRTRLRSGSKRCAAGVLVC